MSRNSVRHDTCSLAHRKNESIKRELVRINQKVARVLYTFLRYRCYSQYRPNQPPHKCTQKYTVLAMSVHHWTEHFSLSASLTRFVTLVRFILTWAGALPSSSLNLASNFVGTDIKPGHNLGEGVVLDERSGGTVSASCVERTCPSLQLHIPPPYAFGADKIEAVAKEKVKELAEQKGWSVTHAEGYIDGQYCREAGLPLSKSNMIGIDDYCLGFRAGYFASDRRTQKLVSTARHSAH